MIAMWIQVGVLLVVGVWVAGLLAKAGRWFRWL